VRNHYDLYNLAQSSEACGGSRPFSLLAHKRGVLALRKLLKMLNRKSAL
jgi:hypothetical protein